MSPTPPAWYQPQEERAVNLMLSNMESLTIQISQRRLDPEQQERYARILQIAERGLLLEQRKRDGE